MSIPCFLDVFDYIDSDGVIDPVLQRLQIRGFSGIIGSVLAVLIALFWFHRLAFILLNRQIMDSDPAIDNGNPQKRY